jgi:transcriptional regulator with XRE-family HTH domain
MSNRTYYRGPDALVTDKLFVWRTTPAKGFAVRELRNVGLVRGDADPLRPYTAHVAAAALVLVAATWTLLNTPAAWVLGFLAVALPGSFAAFTMRSRPRRWELRANYRGLEVVLYASSDVRVFNQVARALRGAREAAHLTQQQVADDMEWSLSKVIRIENGEVSIAPNDLRPLLSYFGVSDGKHVSAMVEDAKAARSRQRDIWYRKPAYRMHVTESLRRLFDYETKAVEMRFYSIYFLPGPLQTPDYAAAVSHLWDDELSATQIRVRIETACRRRQAMLGRSQAPRLLVLLDESVLRRPIGGAAIFARQLRELERLAERDHAAIRMIPFSLDAPVTNNGSFDLLSLSDDQSGGMVLYRENGLADELVEDDQTTSRHRYRFDRVWRQAASELDTIDFIRHQIAGLTRPHRRPASDT